MGLELGVNVTSAEGAWDLVRSEVLRDAGEIKGDETPVLIASLLRRAAAVRCPCPPPALVDAVADALQELMPQDIGGREAVDDVFDGLLASGDLLLPRDADVDVERTLVHLAPPTYVPRKSGALFLLGGLRDIGLALPSGVMQQLVSRGCYRYVPGEPGVNLGQILSDQGFLSYPLDAWKEAPAPRSAADAIAELDARLDSSGRAGDIPDLRILDPDRSPAFYRGRWTSPARRSGRFIARRPRRWGAPLWCYVELTAGEPFQMIDLPQLDVRFRPCDEAWWLQCAIDAERGHPQVLRVSRPANGTVRLATWTPLPMWAERRILLAGEPLTKRDAGALLAFAMDEDEAAQEIDFLSASLWLDIKDLD
jgi:hypothetical protein